MEKVSLYLGEADVQRLRRLSEMEGRSQAAIVRAAIAAYESIRLPQRDFALAGAFSGDGASIADEPDEEVLRGFGD